ncbi:SIMPL domain-containing protein [Paenibacillus sp.]|uniref:SIMPL domain-containing protein n=1 Tax=Paenibacillus sp. TaxID=58172 RepID=UPI002D34E1DA|nr:SIMPL domain-containing protein [Paenibacillus sp.]HZG86930.1 SIMPL domain-containing protein [Paenibacillus sp.]
MMAKLWKRWAAAGLVGALLAAAPLYGPSIADSVKEGTAMAAEAGSERTISVSGSGKMSIEPDVAYVSFGVFTKAKTANEAQTANAAAFAAIEKALKEQFGVAAKDIKTTGFYVQPEYQWSDKGVSSLVGYTADHSVQVAYRDLTGLGKLIDAVSKAGANRMNGIQFGTEKMDAYELQVIEKAMANAKAKADTIAKAAGRSVQSVLHVQQGGVSGGAPIYYPMVKAEAAAMDGGAGTSVQPGQLEITTTVTVTYEM